MDNLILCLLTTKKIAKDEVSDGFCIILTAHHSPAPTHFRTHKTFFPKS